MADENEPPVEVGAPVVPDVDPAIAANAEAAKAEAKAAEPELPLETKPEETEPEKPAEVVPEWARKEINKKHAKNKELERQLAAKEAELESLRVIAQRTTGTEPEAPAYVAPKNDQAAIDAAAARLVAEREYQANVSKIDEAGKKAYGDEWGAALENLVTLGGDGSFTVDVMKGVLATDDPAHVLLELGKNPANYQRIMELSPERRQTELVKIAMQPASKAKVSSAPAPVEPVGGRPAPSSGLRDDMTDDEWNAAQDARERQRWEAKRSGRRLGA